MLIKPLEYILQKLERLRYIFFDRSKNKTCDEVIRKTRMVMPFCHVRADGYSAETSFVSSTLVQIIARLQVLNSRILLI